MLVRSIFLAVWTAFSLFGFLNPASASQEFAKNNPDTGKYAFAHSYISALSYINHIDLRWKKVSPKKLYAGDDVKIMRGYVAYLIQDNADLRIAKNFLSKYLGSPNLLIRKTADLFIGSCITQIAINEKEKEIWDQWYAVKSNKRDTPANEKAFLKAQAELADKRKDAGKTVVQASVLLTKVLKSERNADEKGHLLALTVKERQSLLDRLDEFGKDTLDWGLKPGQDHLQACVAAIREILEDTLYTTPDE